MSYPKLQIDLNKVSHNATVLLELCNKHNIDVTFVTKVFCGDTHIVRTLVEAGAKSIGDTRLNNLARNMEFPIERMQIRLPMKSEVDKTLRYSHTCLCSEIETLRSLSKHCSQTNTQYNVIIMWELGDLREGIYKEEELLDFVKEAITLKGIQLVGIGSNLSCYGGVLPTVSNLSELLTVKELIEKECNITLPIVSGGNSSSIYLLVDNTMPKGVNHLRLGEVLILGRETAYGEIVEGLYHDAITLQAEIVELKDKPSHPIGEIGMNAFGERPEYVDLGIRKRAILAVGRQDVQLEHLAPKDEGINLVGISSDHLIIDVTNSSHNYNIGDIVDFTLSYGGVLSCFTSNYVERSYIEKE